MATDCGFRVHEVVSCKLKINCTQIKGGLRLCQSYNDTNIFFVVRIGSDQSLYNRVLAMWDDQTKEFVAEVEFSKPIIDLKVVGEWIIICDEDTCYVYNLA